MDCYSNWDTVERTPLQLQGSEGQGLLALPIPHCQYVQLTLTVLPSNDVLLTQGSQSNLDFYTLRSSYDLREGLTAIFQNRQVPHLPPDQHPTRHVQRLPQPQSQVGRPTDLGGERVAESK